MPFDVDLDPALFLAMWAAGVAAGASAVASMRVVGPGFLWTAGGTALLVGAFTALSGGWAVAGLVACLFGMAVARRPLLSAGAFALAGSALLVQAIIGASPLPAVTGALALGGATAEMLLGHWYLVDPTLPRWSLKSLGAAGIAGLTLDLILTVAAGGATAGGILPIVYLVLAPFAVLLMVGVWFALRERGYEGVMAATGLSYLALLTALGAVAVARVLLSTV